MTKKGVLLGELNERTEITLELQGARTCRFIYSDPKMARQHYLELTTVGTIGGVAIKNHRIGKEETHGRPRTRTE